LPVTVLVFGEVKTTFKLTFPDERRKTRPMDFTLVDRTIRWFADKTKELEAVAQRLGELDDEGKQKNQKQIAGIMEQSAGGVRGFERALYRLRDLLDECGEDSDEPVEGAPIAVDHGMSPEVRERYNRLAAAQGLDPI